MARILLLDDEEALLRLMADVLEREGHDVITSTDGRRSEEHDLIMTLDLVVTDLMMPNSDGLEVVRNVRATHPELKILAISGGGRAISQNFLPAAQAMGADDILNKPFRPSAFLEKVKSLLDT